ncbi:pyridoxal phosphate-dependent decarboxylase family protein [candidate division KSB1 bacterium]
MVNEIRKLEKTARLLEPGAAARETLLNHARDYAERYLAGIPETPSYCTRSDNGRALYDSPISEEGLSIGEALSLIHENVDTVGANPTSGRFLAYIPGGGLYHAALGDYLAAVSNRYSGVYYASQGAVRMENMLLRWMAGLIGYPDTAAGNLASGGSIANLIAIVTARDAHGIASAMIEKAVVYITGHTHHCIDKALRIAGLNGCIRKVVPVDSAGRMEAGALDLMIRSDRESGRVPWMIVASAGTTNTGAVDPLSDIGEIASARDLWFHIDGAYGALFVLCPEAKKVLRGMDRSDSIVMDPHKTLFLPYGTGAVLVKDRQKLYASHTAGADYMQDVVSTVEEISPADVSPELTKHFRGLRLWLPLKILGVAPFRAALSEKILLARYFYAQMQKKDGFEVGPYPDLSVVTFRYLPKRGDPDEFNQRLIQAIQQEGRVFLSSTRINATFVLRIAVLCFRTHLEDIDEAIDILVNTARKLENE